MARSPPAEVPGPWLSISVYSASHYSVLASLNSSIDLQKQSQRVMKELVWVGYGNILNSP